MSDHQQDPPRLSGNITGKSDFSPEEAPPKISSQPRHSTQSQPRHSNGGHSRNSIEGQPRQSTQGQHRPSIEGQPRQSTQGQHRPSIESQHRHSIEGQPRQSTQSQHRPSIESQHRHSIEGQPRQSTQSQPRHSTGGHSQQSTEGQHRHSIEGQHRHSTEGQHRHSIEGQHRHSIEGQHRHSIEGQHPHSTEGQNRHSIGGQHRHSIDGQHRHSTGKGNLLATSIEEVYPDKTRSSGHHHHGSHSHDPNRSSYQPGMPIPLNQIASEMKAEMELQDADMDNSADVSIIASSTASQKPFWEEDVHSPSDQGTTSGGSERTPPMAKASPMKDLLHHDLKARASDLMYLKQRILYPGMFEPSSDEDEDLKKRRIERRAPKKTCSIPQVNPIVREEEQRYKGSKKRIMMEGQSRSASTITCGSSSTSSGHTKGRKGARKTSDEGITLQQQFQHKECLDRLERQKRRVKKPQSENICEDRDDAKLKAEARKKESLGKATKIQEAKLEEKFSEVEIKDSVLSLNEKLCMLEAESKKPLTLKERYVGYKKIAGYPTCADKTSEYLECLPAGEIVRRAIDTHKKWGIPENTPLSREQLVFLMKKMEENDNNDYICLVYAMELSHQEFNPYFFKIVKYNQVGRRPNYTMSRYGALFISNGMADYTSMIQFQSQIRTFELVRKIPFFRNYRLWKAFYIWRFKIRVNKMTKYKTGLVDHILINKRPLRLMLLEMNKMCEKMNKMCFLHMKHGEAYGLIDFTDYQVKYLREVSDRLRAFEVMVVEMTAAACRATLIEEGFSPDKYPEEMEYYMKQLEIPVHNLYQNRTFDIVSEYPGQWLSFSHQRKKRQICRRIADFIRLVDYLMQRTYHKLLKNSIYLLMLEMHSRIKFIPTQYYLPFDEESMFEEISNKIEMHHGMPGLSDNVEPMFDIGCFWNDEDLVFSPTVIEYIKGFRGIFGCWRQVVTNYKNMLTLSAFHPYTQPIINGYVDHKSCGNGPNMDMMLDLDKELEDLVKNSELILRHGFHVCDKYIKAFNPIRIFCLENQKFDLDILRNETDVQVFTKWLEKLQEQMETLEGVEDLKSMGVFRVNNSILRAHANPTIIRCLDVLRETVPNVSHTAVVNCTQRLKDAREKLAKYPQSADEYVEYLLYLESLQEEMDDIEKDLDIAAELFDLMEKYHINPHEEDTVGFVELQPLLQNLTDDIDEQVAARERIMAELLEQFRVETEEIFKRMEEINIIVNADDVLDPNSDPTVMAPKLTEARDILLADQEKAAKFNAYQKKLKIDITDFDALDKLIVFTKFRHQLWDSLARWDVQKQLWDVTPFHELNHETLTREVNEFVKSIQQLEKGLPPNEVVPILKNKVEEMRAQLPWIANLHNPNIKKRHWDNLEKSLGIELTSDSITLKELLDAGISNSADLIQEVSAQASSESSLEVLLKKVEDSWLDVEFIVLPHKDQRDVFILGGTDDIQVLLDDSLIHMTTISSSRHVGPIKPKVDEWVKLLSLFSDTLEEWQTCQRSWIHLESVFSAPDIQRQLPNEARMFAQVDKSWREIMSRTNRNPLAMRAATQPGLLESLQLNNELLDQIMKCLDDYLESKRVIFPRFYFLSNEELLEILAQTRNPSAVQPHLRKCFDAIQKLEFGGPPSAIALDIVAMLSPEDERVALTKGLKTRGNVEEWLGKVEDAMFNSLKRVTRNSLTDWHTMEREEWIQKFPSQCILTISQLMWAQMVHMILDGPGNAINGMKDFEKKNFDNLNKLAQMVRGQLAPLVRAVLCALITIDVHGRDIITSLVQKKVEKSGNFEWLKQLRYYWNSEQEVVVARMANAQYFYGYEYLGASPRLVITPLTDRCYLCLMGALQLDLGGAPAGPAGTGKTETTKDLAKSLAFMCVVFNCSEGLDYKMMGRFFSGLAQSGGWCCFDEFNRIDIEVLSVIAQQLITIRLAKVQRATKFMFEGREIKLIRTCAAFITMNPGYAGRTELPDNLKALFRPISMMVPDYTLIAEVILYSEGFESSKSLALKMTQMYKLCSEQLSQQDHYDFGMRAVKSVLVMAGSLKRANPDINENIVLIRALRDSNLPKFLAHDAVLLHGIIQDLFPGVVIPEQDYGLLQKESEKCALEKGLQAPECFTLKVIQLYETLVVRHGVMLVGPTGGGKTSIYEVLKNALTALYQAKVDNPFYKPVDTYVLNPKAVSLGELYGEINNLTLEWRDGLLGIMVRNAVRPKMNHHQWIVCDGPVDAIWIENMNTVLDDNKMLCLANSERIKLTNWVRMMFEVQDLAQASPATVSRCGMVYVDPKEMSWRPFVQSWLQRTLVDEHQVHLKPFLLSMFDKYFDGGFAYIKKACQEVMPQSVIGKTTMMCSILQAIFIRPNFDYTLEKAKLFQQVAQIFLFAYIWSVGGNINERDYGQFDNFVRSQFESDTHAKLPKSGILWGYYNNLETRKMEPWESIMSSYIYNPAIPYVDVLVPTVDTVRFGFLMELLLSVNRPVMFTGATGTGKSAIAKYVLTTISPANSYLPIFMNFSAQTTSKRTQEMIEEKLEKRKKSLLSAPMGKKVIVFIDDVNMPKLDRYGAQPAQEFLRQLLDFNGCYDRVKMYWKELQNVIMSAACAPPGGGRNAITPRLLRHFSMMAIPAPSQTVLNNIYRSILRGFLQEFDPDVREMADLLVTAAITTYLFMAKTFLPTPSKSHYLFNMRDLSKCIQGILQANKDVLVNKDNMKRLYFHECLRVFHDRLTTETDRSLFVNSLSEICTSVLRLPTTADEMKGMVFGDFMKMGTPQDDRVYDEIINKDKLKKVLQDYLDEYNIESTKEMNLVFFYEAAEQVVKVTRILRTDRGNALLVGVGGTGKQSLTRLASYISGYRCFQIELMRGYDYSSFHDDLKKLYEVAGMKNQPIVFLFTDTQIAYEEFLEDINNILNSGEVPNLLEPEDLEKLLSGVRAEAKTLGIPENDRDQIYDHFIRRIRSNLHIVLCMSPVGDSFRVRCRMFPSLVNCCTINWFSEWPADALLSVAITLMGKIDLGKTVTPEAMAEVSVFVHESVTMMAEKFYEEMRRRYYTTPSSYLELINLYSVMLKEQRDKILQGKARIQNGLTKLLETNELVTQMRIELKDLEPILVQKSQAVEDLMVVIAEDQTAADVVRKTVQVEESAAKEKATETQAIAEDAQKDLAEALPALEAAVKSLDSLNKDDINELRQFNKPPELVRTVMESVCVLFNVKQDWNTSRQLLGDSYFLKKLYDYDKDTISENTLKKLKVYMDNPKFTPKIVEKVSKACKSICLWVRAVDGYAKIFKTVEPKRNRYLGAQAELEEVMETLRAKQEKLNEVERKIAGLQSQFENVTKEKTDLEDNMELTAARLNRAGRLTKALASEQTRWAESVLKFDEEMQNIIGDVFIGAACIAYFGVFTSEYRQYLVTDWTAKCVELGLPCTQGFSLLSLADPFEVRVWNANGLPRDHTSTENAVLATRGRRWPLMIDPQDQANRWIKQQGASNNLKVIKFSDGTFMRTLENCIRLGYPCLLEEVKESLEPALEPILLKQIFVQTGRTMIRLGDTNVDYDSNFRLYMTTKMSNPHYLPEVCIKVTIINFTVTMSGLEDQLLSDVVSLEQPDLETQRAALVNQINSDKNQLVSLETKILRLLFQSEGNILDDEELVDALNNSKDTATVIIKRVAQSEVTEKSISLAREKYRPAASRGSVLYFVVAQLAELDPMYQYSLKYFSQVFTQCISSTEPTEELDERLKILRKETTMATYTNISRGLFEKDKLVFSFMLCCDILKSKESVSDSEWNFFLRGATSAVETGRKPKPVQVHWISVDEWRSICDLESMFKPFEELSKAAVTGNVKIHIGGFKMILFEAKNSKGKGNDKWDKKLSKFQKLMLIKAVAQQKLIAAITEFVKSELGQKFIESPAADLNEIYKDLNKSTSLIFVLSVGSDPMAGFYRFANEQEYSDRVSSISLGQGQGPIAETMIKAATASGDWVFLQNCHLASSWLPSLERIVEQISEYPEDVHDQFRLFLSSMPTSTFPVSVLQESVKITNEPPRGLRANVRRALIDMEKEFFEDNILGQEWRIMVFGVCFFHAVVQERKKFGPLGWNIKYEFNDSDRECCLLNLEIFCKDGIIPWDALEYITGQITYGGRITDNWDQRCLTTILKIFFSPPTLRPSYTFSPSGLYFAPTYGTVSEYVEYIDQLPIIDEPEIFGMHDNATITFQKQESTSFVNALLTVQPRQVGGSAASESDVIVLELAEEIERKLPDKLDTDKTSAYLFVPDARGRTPSLTIFIQQEIDRFNKLLAVIKDSLIQLKKGIQGLVVMSEDLEKMYHSFLNNQVPDLWKPVSYGSLKSLGSWIKDFLLRFNFIRNWQTGEDSPSSFWLSGYFFQQGFLTAVLQSYARSYNLPIDQLRFHFHVTQVVKEETAQLNQAIEKTIMKPNDGVLIHGIFLEACRWDMNQMTLADSLPGEMNPLLPIIHFLPSLEPLPTTGAYTAPLYKTSIRAGTLSTTGHSTNFIVPIQLPCKEPEDYWILKGAALLSQLTD